MAARENKCRAHHQKRGYRGPQTPALWGWAVRFQARRPRCGGHCKPGPGLGSWLWGVSWKPQVPGERVTGQEWAFGSLPCAAYLSLQGHPPALRLPNATACAVRQHWLVTGSSGRTAATANHPAPPRPGSQHSGSTTEEEHARGRFWRPGQGSSFKRAWGESCKLCFKQKNNSLVQIMQFYPTGKETPKPQEWLHD